mmetsp:Transcript_29264/g.63643  ORF Transcript_29264/g.63643 Transcript_29264/m.63643 type:complete len:208 (+) Transcript_29264:227-850(+)
MAAETAPLWKDVLHGDGHREYLTARLVKPHLTSKMPVSMTKRHRGDEVTRRADPEGVRDEHVVDVAEGGVDKFWATECVDGDLRRAASTGSCFPLACLSRGHEFEGAKASHCCAKGVAGEVQANRASLGFAQRKSLLQHGVHVRPHGSIGLPETGVHPGICEELSKPHPAWLFRILLRRNVAAEVASLADLVVAADESRAQVWRPEL